MAATKDLQFAEKDFGGFVKPKPHPAFTTWVWWEGRELTTMMSLPEVLERNMDYFTRIIMKKKGLSFVSNDIDFFLHLFQVS